MTDYEKLIKQLKSMHIDQLNNLMDDIDDFETITLIMKSTCEWLSNIEIEVVTNNTGKLSEHVLDAKRYLSNSQDAKELDDCQRYNDHKMDNKCYE